MATLTNPISKQNIVDRFADFVANHNNGQIVWGTNTKPFSQMPNATYGGTTAGRSIGITGTSIPGATIDSSDLIATLEGEAYQYTAIRKQRARLLMQTSGTGEANPRVDFDQTNVAYLASGNRVALDGINASTVEEDDIISVTGLETYFADLQREMNEKRDATVTTNITICHSSCHSNCHGSRGRR